MGLIILLINVLTKLTKLTENNMSAEHAIFCLLSCFIWCFTCLTGQRVHKILGSDFVYFQERKAKLIQDHLETLKSLLKLFLSLN